MPVHFVSFKWKNGSIVPSFNNSTQIRFCIFLHGKVHGHTMRTCEGEQLNTGLTEILKMFCCCKASWYPRLILFLISFGGKFQFTLPFCWPPYGVRYVHERWARAHACTRHSKYMKLIFERIFFGYGASLNCTWACNELWHLLHFLILCAMFIGTFSWNYCISLSPSPCVYMQCLPIRNYDFIVPSVEH